MKPFQQDIISSFNIIRNNGTILYPTDTIWGIGCNALNVLAIKKIYQLKKREEKKSMIILLADVNDIKKYVFNAEKKLIDFIIASVRPTTAIFQHAINLPSSLINADGTIAIRIIKDDFCEALLHRLKVPLVSTSANISGEKSPQNFEEINTKIKNGVDYIVQHRQHEKKMNEPSSIIKLNALREVEIIR